MDNRRVYRSYSDQINSRTFESVVPVSYFRRIPEKQPRLEHFSDTLDSRYGVRVETIRENAPPPPTSFYQPYNAHQRETAYLTIPDLVDIYIKKVFCVVVNDLDVMHILHLIDNYLLEIEEYIKDNDKRFVSFAKKLVDLRTNFIYPCFKRNIVKYPKLLEDYRVYNIGISKPLLDMFNFSGNGKNFENGIEKLRYPPYSIEAYTEIPEVKKTVTDIDGQTVDAPEDDGFMSSLFTKWNDAAPESE